MVPKEGMYFSFDFDWNSLLMILKHIICKFNRLIEYFLMQIKYSNCWKIICSDMSSYYCSYKERKKLNELEIHVDIYMAEAHQFLK